MKLEPSLQALQMQIELRVLFGPQAGSRLTLSPGDYDLGAGDDCSVILSGPKMALLHARLSFNGEMIQISPQEGKICDAQGNEIKEPLELTLGMPIEIGGIWISIDDIDAEWPDPSEVIPLMPAVPGPAPASESTDNSNTGSAGTPKNRAKAIFIVAVSSLGLVIALILGGAIWLVSTKEVQTAAVRPVKVAIPDPPTLRKARDIIASSAIGASIEISVTRDRQVLIKGFVPDANTKSSLQIALAKLDPAPKTELLIDAELMESATTLIAEKVDPSRAKLKVESVSGGVLNLEGVVANQGIRDAVMDLLQAGMPGLKRINTNIITAEDLPQLLQDQLASAGLLKKIQIIDKQPEFILRGGLTDDEIKKWEALIINFTERYGKLLPVKATIKLTQRKPPVLVQAIVGGSMPFVMTENGDRITRGGDINGNTLITVKDNEVIFEGSERFKIAR